MRRIGYIYTVKVEFITDKRKQIMRKHNLLSLTIFAQMDSQIVFDLKYECIHGKVLYLSAKLVRRTQD